MIHKIGRRFFRRRAASLIFFNRADVAESLKGKGIPSQKIDTLAAAIVARVNGQELTRTQRDVLRYELGRPSVQKVINDLIQKKTRGIDSAQSNVYDKDDVVGGLENREEAALWDLAYQRAGRDRSGGPGVLREIGSMPPEAFSSAQRRGLMSEVDVFSDNVYATVMEGLSSYQDQQVVFEGIHAIGSKPRTFREATQQDVVLIIGIKTKYNAGKTRNAASARGTINGNSIDLECISGKFSHDNWYNKGNFEPPQPENYHYQGPIPEYTNHTEQKIVEYLWKQFKDYPNVSGEIEIISERIFCDNCKALVDMFETEFPNIKVTRVEVVK